MVEDDGRLSLLDATATPLVLKAIRGLDGAKGIRLRANREMKEGEMETKRIKLLSTVSGGKGGRSGMKDAPDPHRLINGGAAG